jgi:23S rRNA pseudouridine955/2504/2580 synthase/23S rRNA pseudouridine1911/1915/1917 synthase
MDMMAAFFYRFRALKSKQIPPHTVSRLPLLRFAWQQGVHMQRRIQFNIPRLFAGAPLLEFLVRRFPYHDATGWDERVQQNRVQVNGRPADSAQVLVFGDLVKYLASDLPEPRVNLDVTVVFEDADLLAVNKPANLPSHPGGRYFQHTLWAVLKTHFQLEQPILINRLDRETSGVTLVAKNEKAAKLLRTEFSSRRVEKKYLALVEGAFPPRVEARGLLVPDPGSPVKKKMKFIAAETALPEQASQWCETVFQGLETVGPISLVEALPQTGRLHQLRAMLQSLGCPVVGDKLYGLDPEFFTRFCQDQLTAEDRVRLRLNRQALHAAKLCIQHPRTRRTLEFDAPLPADMAALLDGWRGDPPTNLEGKYE